VDGKDYYFLSLESFQKKIAENQFAEWEEVYQNQFYGTLKSEIIRIWEKGHAIVFDIDVQGALSIKEQYGDDCLTIFVKAPSIQVLEERLKSRKSESDESFQKRIVKAKKEMTFENNFDIVIVNDLLDVALKEADYLVKNFIYRYPYKVF
jgi:guanylate kinase